MGFLLVIHILSCILLVITVLMQAGKGGGLAESFTSAESMFGTQTNKFLVRTSTVLAAIFLSTSLVLAVQGSKGDKSIMANKALLPKITTPAPNKDEAEPKITVNVSDPKPAVDIDVTGKTIDLSPEVAQPIVNAAK